MWGRTYEAKLIEHRSKVGSANTLQFFVEEVDINDYIRHRILVHHRNIAPTQKVLMEDQSTCGTRYAVSPTIRQSAM
jgi:hypothetical protein